MIAKIKKILPQLDIFAGGMGGPPTIGDCGALYGGGLP
jgi:hypothetical protein